MSKVICDVCGTTYPETATQCPICGTAKNPASQTVAAGETRESSEGYARVPGGRFSKKNVRKMNSGNAPAPRRRTESSRSVQESKEPNNTGLIIVIVLLVAAILATLAYIVVTRFVGTQPEQSDPPKQTDPVSPDHTDPSEQDIPCTGLQLSQSVLELKVGENWTLQTQLTPVDTTDEVKFSSSNPDIVKISDIGEIMMVGEGEAVITVTCGNQSATCTVKSPGETEPPLPPFTLELNTRWVDDKGVGDVTLSTYGETWKFYKNGSLPAGVTAADITWTSDDPTVATIELGIVKGVGKGTTKVHATFNGTTYSSLIRCVFEVPEGASACTTYMGESLQSMTQRNDATLPLNKSLVIVLKNEDGTSVEVTWIYEGTGLSVDGNTFTALEAGNHTVYCEHEGMRYECIIRVPEA